MDRIAARGLVLFMLFALACGGGAPAADGGGVTGGGRTMLDAPALGVAAAGTALEIPEDAPTVAFVGDSVGAGLHLAEHQAFPAVLQARLAREELPFRLVNASESGRTTSGGVTALGWILRSKPDVVVIELGGNDGLRGVELDQVEANLRAMIAGAREAGATVLLLGVRLPPNYGDYGAEFDALYPRLAEQLELAFVPSFMLGVGGEPEMNLPDGLHPTAEGHEQLADNVLPSLREVLRGLDG
jgi:acyl-CoA thioesterase-1